MSDTFPLGRRAHAPVLILLLLASMTVFATAAFGQLPGTLNGQVLDENGEPIEGVLVTVTDPETPDFEQTATTDDRGRFRVRLANATIAYDYKFSKEGYQEFTNPGLNIPARKNTRMNFTMKSNEAALAAAEAAGEIDPELAARGEAIDVYNQGVVALQGGNQATAESLFKSALEKDADLGAAHAALARIHLKEDRHQEAIDSAQRAIELETDTDSMNQVLYNAYTALGQDQQAAAALEKLKSANPEQASKNIFNQAADAYNKGDIAAAKSGLEQVISVDPGHAKANYLLGLIYINEGENEKAKAHLQKFLELAPSDPDAATAREMLEYLQG